MINNCEHYINALESRMRKPVSGEGLLEACRHVGRVCVCTHTHTLHTQLLQGLLCPFLWPAPPPALCPLCYSGHSLRPAPQALTSAWSIWWAGHAESPLSTPAALSGVGIQPPFSISPPGRSPALLVGSWGKCAWNRNNSPMFKDPAYKELIFIFCSLMPKKRKL